MYLNLQQSSHLEAFPITSRDKTRILIFISIFNIVLENLTNGIIQRNVLYKKWREERI